MMKSANEEMANELLKMSDKLMKLSVEKSVQFSILKSR